MENKMELFSTKEAARRLGITSPTLRQLVKKRKIGVFRIGGRYRFNQFILDIFLAGVFEPQQ
jgi:excisionase family DNA binding protein